MGNDGGFGTRFALLPSGAYYATICPADKAKATSRLGARFQHDRIEPRPDAKPEDYAGLRAELADLASEFLPLTDDMWQRLENHKYRWQLLHYGLPEGYDKFVVSDIIALPIETLQGLRAADNKLRHAHLLADSHNPNQTEAG